MSDELTWQPGWFADPTGRHDHRWWDGTAWTAHVADGGVAGRDELPNRGPSATSATASSAGPAGAAPAGARASGTDPVAIVALSIAIPGLFLALLPVIGVLPALAALILALVARSRVRRSGRPGDGIAIAGLVTGVVGLLIAGLVTAVTISILGGAGGELSGALRDYTACLEVNSQAECRMLLEQSLARMMG